MVKFLLFFCFTWISLASLNGQNDLKQDSLDLYNLESDSVFSNQYLDSTWFNFLESHSLIYNYRTDQEFITISAIEEVYLQRFDSLDAISPIHFNYNVSVDKYIKEYLRYPRFLSKLMGLSEFYFPLIETELDKNDIPLEIKYLSVIESALNPEARSPMGATGLWQFMLPTGKECGLEINSYIDERRDPLKSTQAACGYLKRLYDIYGVWELALAAYNCGPGNVNKAIKKAGGSKNYWKIRAFLPLETQKYIPRFMAVAYLMNFSEEHKLEATPYDVNYWQVDTIKVHDQMRFDQITACTEITSEELKLLNPELKSGVIPKSSTGYLLKIPIRKIDLIAKNKEQILAYKPSSKPIYVSNTNPKPDNRKSSGNKIYYTIRNGDVLGTIAEKHDVSVTQIKRWNGIRGTRIRAGQKLVLFVEETKPSTTKNKETKNTITESGDFTIYTIRKGDTLWDIAKMYPGVSADNIKDWNTAINPKNLKAGMKLRIKT